MVRSNRILRGVKKRLREAWPEMPAEAFYTNLAPVNFIRPSFLIESGPREKAPRSYATLAAEAKVVVTAFSAVDKIHHSQVEALEDLTDDVEALFLAGYVELGEAGEEDYRALEVVSTEADVGFDYGQVTVTLAYEDERPVAEEDYPPMEDVEVRTGTDSSRRSK